MRNVECRRQQIQEEFSFVEYHPALPVIICDTNVFNFYLTDWLLGEKIWFILEFIHITFNVTTQYQLDLWALFMEINSFNNIDLETHCFQTFMIRLGLSISLFPPFLSSIHYFFFTIQNIFDFSFHITQEKIILVMGGKENR